MKKLISIKGQILWVPKLIIEIWINKISVIAQNHQMVPHKTHPVLTHQAHLRVHLLLKSSRKKISLKPKSSSKRQKRPRSKRKTKESFLNTTQLKLYNKTRIKWITKRLSQKKNWQ